MLYYTYSKTLTSRHFIYIQESVNKESVFLPFQFYLWIPNYEDKLNFELPKLTENDQYFYYSDYINLSIKNIKMQNTDILCGVNKEFGLNYITKVSSTSWNYNQEKISKQIQITHR
jgi:hypothetical protein